MRTNSQTTEIQTKTSHSQQRRKKNFIARVFAAGKPFEVAKKYSKVKPMGGRVLIKIARTEVETKGGVLLTQGSQMKPTSGTCIYIFMFDVVRARVDRFDFM
jgi:hypothetical protein